MTAPLSSHWSFSIETRVLRSTASRISRAAWLHFVFGFVGLASWSSMFASFQATTRSRLGITHRARLPPWPEATNASGGRSAKSRLPSLSVRLSHQLKL